MNKKKLSPLFAELAVDFASINFKAFKKLEKPKIIARSAFVTSHNYSKGKYETYNSNV